MGKGIVAKIWNIKAGSMGRGSGEQIGDSIRYITNDEKCSVTLTGAMPQLKREMTYVTNDVKTLEGLYVGCRNISDIKNAVNEMLSVKEFYGKTGGRVALHGIISMDEEESDPKNAGKLMMLLSDLLEEVFPDYQAVYAVHTNTENLHIHFILNTVGLSGKKMHMDKSFMSGVFDPCLNSLAIKYGFTPNAAWDKQAGKIGGEGQDRAEKLPFKVIARRLRNAIDLAIEETDDFDGFLQNLRSKGIAVHIGKYMSLKMPEMTRPVRTKSLGREYTLSAINNRILTKRDELIKSSVADHIPEKGNPLSYYVKTTPLKKYRDMSDEEKARCIKLLRMGKNPWRQRYQNNWQIERLTEEFNRTADVYMLISTFAPDSGAITDAMSNIIAKQHEISEEKKKIREGLRHYKPVIDLYREMQKVERKAFLYECGADEYLSEYLSYQTLSKRLYDGYSKTIVEVAEFVEDQENALLYANAQSRELSDCYKTLLRFSKEKEKDIGYTSIFDAIGYSRARRDAKEKHLFTTAKKYIAANGADGGYLRVLITPDMVKGEATVTCDIEIFNRAGKKVNAISSADMPVKAFNQAILDIKENLGLFRCHEFETEEEARAYAEAQEEEKKKEQKKIYSAVPL